MTLKAQILYYLYFLIGAAALAGCASTSGPAPILDRATIEQPAAPPETEVSAISMPIKVTARKMDWRPWIYVVQRGDTLYSIAFNHGLDYREIADLNKIVDPNVIQVGQKIRLFPVSVEKGDKTAVESESLEIQVKDQPKAIKLPYSEQAMAEIMSQQESPRKSAAKEASKVAEPEPKPEPEPEPKASAAANNAGIDADDAIDWGMPTNGTVISAYSESGNRKGIDVAGTLGQPVLASATGKVVYSGSGLRGYGKLVIIKHNKTYLSAYAHNDQILVKEGQSVTKGQKIAEMGRTDSDQVKLHFEIRKLGRPVDPSQFLPLKKS